MNDDGIAALQPGQILLDRDGREWRVLHEPKHQDSTNSHWVMARSGDFGKKLSYLNAAGYRVKE